MDNRESETLAPQLPSKWRTPSKPPAAAVRRHANRLEKPKPRAPSPVLDIPYFAHMQLSPARYPTDVGIPVGGPPHRVVPYGGYKATNGMKDNTWDSSDDEDTAASEDENNSKKRKASAIGTPLNGLGGTDHKKTKIAGGRPALPKKVVAEMDSDDELIVRMKQAKYQEKEIAQRLIDEGRTNYHPKTIGTRWARLKKVLQKHNDELLDQGLTDWHDGDDSVLQEAIVKADVEVEKIKQEADARKWRIVADKMKVIKPVVNFSRNACRKRHEELLAGTAKPTPESILNPDDDVKARIQARKNKEKAIEATGRFTAQQENMNRNGWTSRMRDDF